MYKAFEQDLKKQGEGRVLACKFCMPCAGAGLWGAGRWKRLLAQGSAARGVLAQGSADCWRTAQRSELLPALLDEELPRPVAPDEEEVAPDAVDSFSKGARSARCCLRSIKT